MRYGFISVGAENIIYDGVNLSERFDITDAQIQVAPEISVSSVKIPGVPGTHFGSLEYGDRELILKMSLKTWDRNKIHQYQFWREFTPLLLKEEPKPMQLDESRTINVIVSEIGELERLGTRGIAEVTFLANDPFFYGQTRCFEINAGENAFVMDNPYSVWPVLELSEFETEEALVITDESTGNRIYIPEVSEGTVKVDMGRRHCYLDDTYLPVDPAYTTFFALNEGPVNIKLSSGHGTLTYKERFL